MRCIFMLGCFLFSQEYMQPLEVLLSTYLKSPHDVKSITKALRTFKNFLSIGNFSSLYETMQHDALELTPIYVVLPFVAFAIHVSLKFKLFFRYKLLFFGVKNKFFDKALISNVTSIFNYRAPEVKMNYLQR